MNNNIILAELGSKGIFELTRKEKDRQYFLIPKRTVREIIGGVIFLIDHGDLKGFNNSQLLGMGIAKMLVDRIKGITPEEVVDYFPVVTHALFRMFEEYPQLTEGFDFNEEDVYKIDL